jgi:hypothetical protein
VPVRHVGLFTFWNVNLHDNWSSKMINGGIT